MNIDLSVEIKRQPESKNYRLNLLVIKNGKPDKFETYVCQTLVEIFEKISAFEAANFELFQNAIEYKHIDWRQLARQNKAKGVAK
ncbi:hypothetical protein [Kingella oralis]|uniref:hypothetical protein n=1 Tax=Kingella oralis TaxID=505 RepID=UPI0028EDC1C2|nr:hypothetical protein [Kingella oralis]